MASRTRAAKPENGYKKARADEVISIEEAVTALRRSGYLLETRIARQVEKFASRLAVNFVYADPETGTSRELDIYSFGGEVSERNEFFSASAHLLIECVNNPQPIAFFSGSQTLKTTPIVAARPSWIELQPITDYLEIADFHHHYKSMDTTNYCTFVTKKSGEWMVTHADEQHQEFSTLAKLAELVKAKQCRTLEDESRPVDAMEICAVDYIFPILVVEGLIFDVKQGNDGSVRIDAVEHTRYRRTHIWQGARRYCPIDIVTEKQFPRLLQQINFDCKRTLARMDRRADEIVRSARTNEDDRDREEEDFLP
jgi:hypothetical protein